MGKCCIMALLLFGSVFIQAGCRTPSDYRDEADRVASDVIAEKQKEALEEPSPSA